MAAKPRVIIIVLDSVGIGALPDAADYGDAGTNSLAHLAEAAGSLNLPNLARMGLGNIAQIRGVGNVTSPEGCWGKMAEMSKGKDTTTGHRPHPGICAHPGLGSILPKRCGPGRARKLLGPRKHRRRRARYLSQIPRHKL